MWSTYSTQLQTCCGPKLHFYNVILKIHLEIFIKYLQLWILAGCRNRDIQFCHQIFQMIHHQRSGRFKAHMGSQTTWAKLINVQNAQKIASSAILNVLLEISLTKLVSIVQYLETFLVLVTKSLKSIPVTVCEFCLSYVISWIQ